VNLSHILLCYVFVSWAFDVSGLFWRWQIYLLFPCRDPWTCHNLLLPFFLYISTGCMEIYWSGRREQVAVFGRLWGTGKRTRSEQVYVITRIIVAVYRYLSFWRLLIPDEPHDHSIHHWNHSVKFCKTCCNKATLIVRIPFTTTTDSYLGVMQVFPLWL